MYFHVSSRALSVSATLCKLLLEIRAHLQTRLILNTERVIDETTKMQRKAQQEPESHLLETVRGRFARALSRCAKDEGIQVICRGDVCSLINLPYSERPGICSYENEHALVHTRGEIQPRVLVCTK